MDTDNSLYTNFPFKVNKHTEFILRQLHTIHEDYGFRGTTITVQSFSEKYPATIKTNNNAYQLLLYLQGVGAIKLDQGNAEGIVKVKTPLKVWRVLDSAPEWDLVILSQHKVDKLYGQVQFINENFNISAIGCSLAFARNEHSKDTLYLRARTRYPLWTFNDSLTKDILKLLIGEAALERKDGYVRLANAELRKSPPLHAVLKNAGFNKKLKEWFFTVCKADKVIMKPYTMLSGRDMDYMIATFQDKKKNVDKSNSQKSDFSIS